MHFLARSKDALCSGGLPLLRSTLQHAKCPSRALARRLHGNVKSIDQVHDFWSNLDHILDFVLHLLLFLLLDCTQLAWEVFWLNRVEDGEEKFAVAGGLAVETLVWEVAHDVRLLVAVFDDTLVGELLVARNSDLAHFVVLEVALAPVHDSSKELHRAVAVLREKQLT